MARSSVQCFMKRPSFTLQMIWVHLQLHPCDIRNDTPNLWDHDFPYPTSSQHLATKCKLKEVVTDNQPNKEQEKYARTDLNDYLEDPDSDDFQECTIPIQGSVGGVIPCHQCKDKLGRFHFKKTTYGPAVLVLRGLNSSHSSSECEGGGKP